MCNLVVHEEPKLKLGIPFQKLGFFLFLFRCKCCQIILIVKSSLVMHEELKLTCHSKLAF